MLYIYKHIKHLTTQQLVASRFAYFHAHLHMYIYTVRRQRDAAAPNFFKVLHDVRIRDHDVARRTFNVYRISHVSWTYIYVFDPLGESEGYKVLKTGVCDKVLGLQVAREMMFMNVENIEKFAAMFAKSL